MIRKSMPLGLDPKVVTGFPKRSCSNKKIERDDDSKKTHPALETGPVPTSAIDKGRLRAAFFFGDYCRGLLVKAGLVPIRPESKALFDIFCISRGISNARATACPDRPDDSLVGSRICPNQALAQGRAGCERSQVFHIDRWTDG